MKCRKWLLGWNREMDAVDFAVPVLAGTGLGRSDAGDQSSRKTDMKDQPQLRNITVAKREVC